MKKLIHWTAILVCLLTFIALMTTLDNSSKAKSVSLFFWLIDLPIFGFLIGLLVGLRFIKKLESQSNNRARMDGLLGDH
jgi:cytochrome b561